MRVPSGRRRPYEPGENGDGAWLRFSDEFLALCGIFYRHAANRCRI